MAKGVKPRVKVPKKAAAGETITIKTLISHKMESGQRKDDEGNHDPALDHQPVHLPTFNGQNVIDVTHGAGDFDEPVFPVSKPPYPRPVNLPSNGTMTMAIGL